GQVAVKVMRGLLERDSDQLARFQREAEVIEDLRHPNIVQMFEYDIIDEAPYLVMEYVPGPSLATYLKKLHDHEQRLPIGIVAHILKSIASALDYAHLKGLVHRDIKPANVLLRSQSEPIELDKPLPVDVEPILTDFGLVRLLDSTMLTTAGSVSGTPTYMSPEQARGEKVDKRTDIYSLGIVLYEMLAGTVPFQADTTFGMLMKHINEPPPPIPGISADLQALIDRALAKDPALRYESAGDLANEFIALFNGQTISPGTLHLAELARQASDTGQQGKIQLEKRSPNRWIRIGIEAAIVLILAFVIYQFVNPNRITALAPNVPIGRLHLRDANFYMDGLSLTLNNNIPKPGTNMHYEGWLVADDGKTIRSIGPVASGPSGIWRLDYSDPAQDNLLRNFNQIQITEEHDNVPITTPTGEILYSSIFPPKALEQLRHVIVSHEPTPDQGPLMQNLWYYSGDYINKSINGDEFDNKYLGIVQALKANDEAALRKRTEEVINQIVGSLSKQYLDYDHDGQIEQSGDGYGSLPQDQDHLGYIEETALYTKNAVEASDSTTGIRTYGGNVQICLQNMEGWTNDMLQLALQLNQASFGPEMQPIITQLSDLGNKLVHGVDVDKDGIIDPVKGECGADTAYDNAYLMADFQIYPGSNRISPTGK
ncbi:MAG TPA: serine/threonine-protein kinase, partial [Anaerolineales bacterium]|nr:serine/threonine-protein kinase [Anaerolineales bacterium]